MELQSNVPELKKCKYESKQKKTTTRNTSTNPKHCKPFQSPPCQNLCNQKCCQSTPRLAPKKPCLQRTSAIKNAANPHQRSHHQKDRVFNPQKSDCSHGSQSILLAWCACCDPRKNTSTRHMNTMQNVCQTANLACKWHSPMLVHFMKIKCAPDAIPLTHRNFAGNFEFVHHNSTLGCQSPAFEAKCRRPLSCSKMNSNAPLQTTFELHLSNCTLGKQ